MNIGLRGTGNYTGGGALNKSARSNKGTTRDSGRNPHTTKNTTNN